jgi:hypothetical protein
METLGDEKMKTETKSNAWGNWEIDLVCKMITGKVGGVKVRPDEYVYKLSGTRMMPGMLVIAEHENYSDAINHLRNWVGV